MAHGLGIFLKWLGAGIVIGLSVTLSYTFFASIAPPDKPWFVWPALGLTEGGFLIWFAVFRLTRHHAAKKDVALVMVILCLITILAVDVTQLQILFQEHGLIAQNPWLSATLFYILEFMLAAHLLAFVVDMLIGYFEDHPGAWNEQPGRNLIPAGYSVEELESMQHAITGTIATVKNGATADPLASRQLPRPKSEEEMMILAQMATVAKEAVSTATKKVKNFTKGGSKRGKSPGQTNEITSESTSTNVDPYTQAANQAIKHIREQQEMNSDPTSLEV